MAKRLSRQLPAVLYAKQVSTQNMASIKVMTQPLFDAQFPPFMHTIPDKAHNLTPLPYKPCAHSCSLQWVGCTFKVALAHIFPLDVIPLDVIPLDVIPPRRLLHNFPYTSFPIPADVIPSDVIPPSATSCLKFLFCCKLSTGSISS